MANDPIKLVDVGALDRFKTDIENEIPDSVQYSTMPTASADWVGKIVQYTGPTTSSYTNGYFYKCVPGSTSGTYEWIPVSVQSGGSSSSVQSDWNQTDNTADDYIKNKPDLTEHLPIIPTLETKTTASVSIDEVGTAIDVTWSGLTSFNGSYVWTDGTNIYYSNGSTQYVLDKSTSTWVTKTWTGLTNFGASFVWTDGTDIYYSSASVQYVLDKSTSTWTAKTWTGLPGFYGSYVWTDETDIYYSNDSTQYVLDKSTSTWTAKTWSGLTSFTGSFIWTDGTDIYYSRDSTQYVLDKSTSTWTTKIWTGLTSFYGSDVWTDGTNIYYSNGSTQYVLDKSTSTWITKTWTGLTSFYASFIWTDGIDIYYSYNGVYKKIINRRHVNNNFNSGNIQSDWSQTDSTADDYIKNKPTLGTAAALNVATSGNASSSQVVKGNDSRLTDSRNAADVSSWAKAPTKPSYTASEIENAIIVTSSIPTASATNVGKVYLYVGESTNLIYNGWFYKCEYDGSTYSLRTFNTKAVISGNDNPVTSGAVYTALQGKVDAVSGKGLSTNDYTTAEQTKLSGIATGATANTVIDTTVTISASKWSGSSAPYTATKFISNILSTDTPIIDVVVSSTISTGLDQLEQYSYISRAVTTTGYITFYCYEDKPDIDLTIAVKVVR